MVAVQTMMRRTARTACIAALLASAACGREKAPVPGSTPATASAPGQPSRTPGAPAVALEPWDDELGVVLATPALDGGSPVLFVRDTAGTAELDVELFTHDDRTSRATARPGSVIRSCAWRRNGSLATADGRAPTLAWSLALSPGMATPLAVDGVGELRARDSAAVIAKINRLVSAIPDDSASAPFRGLPIVVRDAWRFQLADSTGITVAIAMRSVNQESNPRVQAITLIAEPDPASASGQWRTAYWERVAGPEDRLEGTDLLAAFLVRGSRPAVALVREGDEGLQLEVVERSAPGVWAVRWTSSSLPCARR